MCHREQITHHLIPFCFALFILDCQFLCTPYVRPSCQQTLSQVCWLHILLIGSSAFQRKVRHIPEAWRPCMVSLNFPSRFPPQSSYSLLHSMEQPQPWKMGNMSHRPNGSAFSGFCCCFLFSFLSLPPLAVRSHQGFWVCLLCNPLVHLWMVSLLFCINISYEQHCLVKLGRLSS